MGTCQRGSKNQLSGVLLSFLGRCTGIASWRKCACKQSHSGVRCTVPRLNRFMEGSDAIAPPKEFRSLRQIRQLNGHDNYICSLIFRSLILAMSCSSSASGIVRFQVEQILILNRWSEVSGPVLFALSRAVVRQLRKRNGDQNVDEHSQDEAASDPPSDEVCR